MCSLYYRRKQRKTGEFKHPPLRIHFLRATAVPAGTAEARISYGNSVCLSVRLSVCLSRPGGIPRPGEIETPGLHVPYDSL